MVTAWRAAENGPAIAITTEGTAPRSQYLFLARSPRQREPDAAADQHCTRQPVEPAPWRPAQEKGAAGAGGDRPAGVS